MALRGPLTRSHLRAPALWIAAALLLLLLLLLLAVGTPREPRRPLFTAEELIDLPGLEGLPLRVTGRLTWKEAAPQGRGDYAYLVVQGRERSVRCYLPPETAGPLLHAPLMRLVVIEGVHAGWSWRYVELDQCRLVAVQQAVP